MDKTIIVAIIGAIALIIANNLPYINEHYGEKINKVVKSLSIVFIIVIIIIIIMAIYIKEVNGGEGSNGTSISSEGTKDDVEYVDLVGKYSNIELNKLLEYEPKINNITEEEFNSFNEYYVQMITVSKSSTASDLVEIVKDEFPGARWEQTQNGLYRVILEENRGISIKDLNEEAYNKEVNKILKEKGIGSCDILICASNKYIEDEVKYIESLVDIMKEQSSEDIKYKCGIQIGVVKYHIDKYLEHSVFEGYKKRLSKVLEEIR